MTSNLCVVRTALGAAVLALFPSLAVSEPFVFPPGTDTTAQAYACVDYSPFSTCTVSSIAGTSTSKSAVWDTGSGEASIDLLTGELKVFGSGTNGFSIVTSGLEFVTFEGSATVDVGFDLEGTLRNISTDGTVRVTGWVSVRDVTTWPTYFCDLGGIKSPDDDCSFGTPSPAPLVVLDASSQVGWPECELGSLVPCTLSGAGDQIPVNLSASGSFDAIEGKLYLIELSLSVFTSHVFDLLGDPSDGFQEADFANTGTFSFTNLNGITFQSASGAFLSEQQQIPEPAATVLFGLGAIATWTARRRIWAGRPRV